MSAYDPGSEGEKFRGQSKQCEHAARESSRRMSDGEEAGRQGSGCGWNGRCLSRQCVNTCSLALVPFLWEVIGPLGGGALWSELSPWDWA